MTPRARSCGCASCSTFLRLRLRLPPGSLRLGRGVSCRANATRPGQHPGQHPAAPREPLRASWAWCREEPGNKGCAKHHVRPSPSSSSCAKAFPGVEVSQGILAASLAMPTPCPGGLAALAPGSPSLLLSGRRQPRRAAAPWGRAGGSHQGRKPLFGTLPPCPGGAHSPPALGGPALGVTSFPRGLCKPQPLFRAPSVPRPAGGAGRGWPRGCRCQGCPRPPVPGPRR